MDNLQFKTTHLFMKHNFVAQVLYSSHNIFFVFLSCFMSYMRFQRFYLQKVNIKTKSDSQQKNVPSHACKQQTPQTMQKCFSQMRV